MLSFSSVPIGVLEEGVTGWVRTTNGQWISEEGVIPKRFSSFDDKLYEQKHNRLGMDNLHAIEVFDVTYGDERLWAIVKYFYDLSNQFALVLRPIHSGHGVEVLLLSFYRRKLELLQRMEDY